MSTCVYLCSGPMYIRDKPDIDMNFVYRGKEIHALTIHDYYTLILLTFDYPACFVRVGGGGAFNFNALP